MKTIELYLPAGVPDWNGEAYKEDRYIVLENGFDLTGEHMTKQEAEKITRTVHPGSIPGREQRKEIINS